MSSKHLFEYYYVKFSGGFLTPHKVSNIGKCAVTCGIGKYRTRNDIVFQHIEQGIHSYWYLCSIAILGQPLSKGILNSLILSVPVTLMAVKCNIKRGLIKWRLYYHFSWFFPGKTRQNAKIGQKYCFWAILFFNNKQ